MSALIKLEEVNNQVFTYKKRKVVPSQAYSKFCGKEVRTVNQALQRLEKKGRLRQHQDFFKIFRDQITGCDLEQFQPFITVEHGGVFLTRKAVNTLSHYFDDQNSVTLSQEVNELATNAQNTRESTDPMIRTFQELILLRERQLALEAEQRTQAQQINKVETKLKEFDGETGCRTIISFSRGVGISIPLSVAQSAGKRAAKKCRDRGLPVGHAPDERYGKIRTYPIVVLDEVFKELKLI